jgi:CTP-dependent riboflavin kinase
MKITINKWINILAYLLLCKEKGKDVNLKNVKDELSLSFSHTQRNIMLFDELGWINKKRKGRIINIELTKKGIEYADKCFDLVMSLEKDNVIQDN